MARNDPIQTIRCRRERRISAWCTVCSWTGRSPTPARTHTLTTGHETRYTLSVRQEKGYRHT
jgi:hypothetical protein